MPCILVLLALLTPRLVIAVVWLFTNWFNGMFPGPLWPVVGFIFLPTAFLWYSAVVHFWAGQWTLGPVIGMVIALIIDLSPASHPRFRRRGR